MRFGVVSRERSAEVPTDLSELISRLIRNYQTENISIEVSSVLPSLNINSVRINEIFKNLFDAPEGWC